MASVIPDRLRQRRDIVFVLLTNIPTEIINLIASYFSNIAATIVTSSSLSVNLQQIVVHSGQTFRKSIATFPLTSEEKTKFYLPINHDRVYLTSKHQLILHDLKTRQPLEYLKLPEYIHSNGIEWLVPVPDAFHPTHFIIQHKNHVPLTSTFIMSIYDIKKQEVTRSVDINSGASIAYSADWIHIIGGYSQQQWTTSSHRIEVLSTTRSFQCFYPTGYSVAGYSVAEAATVVINEDLVTLGGCRIVNQSVKSIMVRCNKAKSWSLSPLELPIPLHHHSAFFDIDTTILTVYGGLTHGERNDNVYTIHYPPRPGEEWQLVIHVVVCLDSDDDEVNTISDNVE